jgi:predicted ATP-grasp superfamily ATP-dependent carboligase
VPNAPSPPVLIFGAHIAALGVLRVLARRGLTASVVDATSNIIVRSRWYRPTSPTLAESPDPAALADFLESLDLERAVLIACSDQWALAVAGLPAATRALTSAWAIRSSGLPRRFQK